MPDDREESVEGVNQADLFALVICTATVADWYFVNTGPPFCKLDREFRLKPKSVARQGNTLEQRCADGFIAGFHVREVQVTDQIASQGEHPVRL